MPPASSDESFRQPNRYLGDNIPIPQEPSRSPQEHEPSGKNKKKGKTGSKGKDKTAKAVAKIPPLEEDLYVSGTPSVPLGTPVCKGPHVYLVVDH